MAASLGGANSAEDVREDELRLLSRGLRRPSMGASRLKQRGEVESRGSQFRSERVRAAELARQASKEMSPHEEVAALEKKLASLESTARRGRRFHASFDRNVEDADLLAVRDAVEAAGWTWSAERQGSDGASSGAWLAQLRLSQYCAVLFTDGYRESFDAALAVQALQIAELCDAGKIRLFVLGGGRGLRAQAVEVSSRLRAGGTTMGDAAAWRAFLDDKYFEAAEGGDGAMVSAMVSITKELLGVKDVHGNTALMLAADNGHSSVVRVLAGNAEQGHIDARNAKGFSALMLAAANGDIGVSRALVEAGADKSSQGKEAMLVVEAAKRGDVALVEVLLADPRTPEAAGSESKSNTAAAAGAPGAKTVDTEEARSLRRMAEANAPTDAVATGCRPLHLAADLGDAAAVRELVNAGAQVNTRDGTRRGATALLRAVEGGHLEAVKALAAAGADLDAKTHDDGETALMAAAAEGNIEAVKVLIEAGAGLNLQSEDGSTAAMSAVESDSLEALEALIAAGADLDLRNGDGNTALVLAAIYDHTPALEALTNADAALDTRNVEEFTALIIAAKFGHARAVEVLLRSGADQSLQKDGKKALMWAASKEVMKALIEVKADPEVAQRQKFKNQQTAPLTVNERGAGQAISSSSSRSDTTSLVWAAMHGKAAEVESLLRVRNADTGGDEERALATKFRRMTAANVFDNKTGKCPIHSAVLDGDAAKVKELLAAGARPNARDGHGESALILAAHHGRGEALRVLITGGSDLDAQTPRGNTALIFASAKGMKQLYTMLRNLVLTFVY